MNETTSTYEILRTSWGIWIQITAHHRVVDTVSNKGIRISDRIRFSYEPKIKYPDENDVSLLTNGLKWIASLIEKRIENGILIVLTDLQIVPTDFQPEGFYYGIAKWAGDHFNFDLPEYKVDFNSSENRYKFPDLVLFDNDNNENE